MIGALRHLVELLEPVRLDDGAGGAETLWSPTAALWARVERLASTRDFAGDRARRLARIAATIRQRNGISLGARLRFAGGDYEIVGVEDADERGVYVTLVCEEAIA